MAAVLVTASFFVAGCEAGEAHVDGAAAGAVASGGAAPGSERRVDADTMARPTIGPGPLDATAGEAERLNASTQRRAPASADSDSRSSGDAARPEAGASPAGTGSVGGSVAGAPRAGASTSEPSEVADASPSDQGASPEEILRATSRAYEGLRSFRAGFEQTLQNTLLGRTITSSGTLYQRQPDRFLMDFSDPPNDLIVSDGDYFWMYFPSVDAKQVLRTPRGGQGLDLRAQFVGDPIRRFETTYHGTESVRGRRAYVMTLVPRESLGYSRLKVWIDAADHLVRRFELTEGNGNVRYFELRDLVANPSLSDDLFEFNPPAGTQVVTR